jgi:hypothetical protein
MPTSDTGTNSSGSASGNFQKPAGMTDEKPAKFPADKTVFGSRSGERSGKNESGSTSARNTGLCGEKLRGSDGGVSSKPKDAIDSDAVSAAVSGAVSGAVSDTVSPVSHAVSPGGGLLERFAFDWASDDEGIDDRGQRQAQSPDKKQSTGNTGSNGNNSKAARRSTHSTYSTRGSTYSSGTKSSTTHVTHPNDPTTANLPAKRDSFGSPLQSLPPVQPPHCDSHRDSAASLNEKPNASSVERPGFLTGLTTHRSLATASSGSILIGRRSDFNF